MLSQWVSAYSAIMAGAILGTEARLGVGCIVNCGAVVDHHATVEDFGQLGVNASMAGGSLLGRSAWMQAGAALGYGVMVPSGEVLPPGSARKMSRP
jgi:UDP-3-O-[3-hydroxymyristoyl] glucosamine N-acyltransferase